MGIEVICAFNVLAIGVLLVTKEYLLIYIIFSSFFRKREWVSGTSTYDLLPGFFSGDTDQVVRDLFGPLVDQLIHWFTRRAGGGGRSEVRRREAECLLTAILSGLSNDEEGTGKKCLLITRYSNGFNLALKLCSAVITVELTQLIFC